MGRRLGCCCLLLLATGCVTRVTGPVAPVDPVTVYLVENEMHGGIVLPTTRESVVQFDYGDWGYYAEDRKGSLSALYALFWCSPGTLARREVRGIPTGPQEVCDRLWADKALPLMVERAACRDLLGSLEERFRRQSASSRYDPALDTTFVRDEQAYHLFHTCNHEILVWLERLDCRVSGWWWTWEFELAEQPAAP